MYRENSRHKRLYAMMSGFKWIYRISLIYFPGIYVKEITPIFDVLGKDLDCFGVKVFVSNSFVFLISPCGECIRFWYSFFGFYCGFS